MNSAIALRKAEYLHLSTTLIAARFYFIWKTISKYCSMKLESTKGHGSMAVKMEGALHLNVIFEESLVIFNGNLGQYLVHMQQQLLYKF